MVLAMAGFALEDMLIKITAETLPTGQVVITIGILGAAVIGIVAVSGRHALIARRHFTRLSVFRILAELTGALCFITAITLTPLSSASAILQAAPLFVAIGGALFLNETVGWRRWSAILVGLAGVLLIVRPGWSDFEPLSLFAVGAAIALAARDVAIKASPSTLPSSVMAFQGMIVFSMSGVILLALDRAPVIPDATNWTMLGLASLIGVGGYFAIITAIRIGEVALVSPFRYTRMLFALLIGIVVFRERPDMLTYLGAAIVVSSGLYTLYREQKLRRTLRIAAAS